jgi:hypothetical protein
MSVYFVNCDDLRLAMAVRGLAGEWVGDDEAVQFTGVNGAMLCWLVKRSMVLTGGENVEELVERLPELIPWEEAMHLYRYVTITFPKPVDARTAFAALEKEIHRESRIACSSVRRD